MTGVLHLSYADAWGGSARSARRIHENLRTLGHRSRMLVHRRDTDDPDTAPLVADGLPERLEAVGRALGARVGWPEALLPSRVVQRFDRRFADCDVVQLYNLHGGWIDLGFLPRLSARKPVIWRLSDMWAATGHCAYSGDCTRWRTGCGQCPDLATYPPLSRDTTAAQWQRKNRLYAASSVAIVAPASWSERLAKESPLLSRFDVRRIPNGVETAVFAPMERARACAMLGIADAPATILFGAHIAGETRKGGATLIAALNRLGARPGLRILALGRGGDELASQVPQPVVSTGYLEDSAKIAAAIAASDIVAIPSRADNLPNTVLEAMSVGTALVASNAGGIRDAVRDGETGLLVAPDDAQALAAALARLLDDADLRRALGARARAAVMAEYDAKLEAQRFASLYAELLAARA
jgi:glycosyltransferase involved in cell wall biosynthesis